MDINAINQLAMGIEATQGFRQIPPGRYPGYIENITQKTTKDGTPFWEFNIRTNTSEGDLAVAGIWGFSPDDRAKADYDNDVKQNIAEKIGRAKGLFVALGFSCPAGWSDAPNTVLEMLPQLRGRQVLVVSAPQKRDPSRTTQYINAPDEAGQSQGQGQMQPGMAPQGQQMQPGIAPGQQQGVHPGQQQAPGMAPGGTQMPNTGMPPQGNPGQGYPQGQVQANQQPIGFNANPQPQGGPNLDTIPF